MKCRARAETPGRAGHTHASLITANSATTHVGGALQAQSDQRAARHPEALQAVAVGWRAVRALCRSVAACLAQRHACAWRGPGRRSFVDALNGRQYTLVAAAALLQRPQLRWRPAWPATTAAPRCANACCRGAGSACSRCIDSGVNTRRVLEMHGWKCSVLTVSDRSNCAAPRSNSKGVISAPPTAPAPTARWAR